MKRNAQKIQDEVGDQDSELHVVETPPQRGGAKTLILPSAAHAPRLRPEIAVLGWEERSYRLSLRESKA
jgi:hypothetical protein